MAAPAIQVQDLSKQYGPVTAVDHVSFQVNTGELVGFLGLNGAGKSTTMKILTTFLPASSGLASVSGFDVMYQSMEVRKNLGYLPESVPLYPEFRVEEYLAARAKLKSVPRTARTARIDYCLERCRIREVRRRLIGTLSKGYKQRVGLADALLSDPPVLILDEPLSGLDPIQQDETLHTIRDLGTRHTVLFSSHQLSDVEKICNRVIIIHRGRVEFDSKLIDNAGRMEIDDKFSEFASQGVRYIVDARGPAAQVEAALRQMPHVQEVKIIATVESNNTYELRADQDVREAVVQLLVGKGWPVRGVAVRREKLQDIFMRVAYKRS